jgi:hypothetical protein
MTNDDNSKFFPAHTEMVQETVQELTEAAMTFWQSAEAPTANDMDILFTALAEHDHGAIEELFDRFKLTTPWKED